MRESSWYPAQTLICPLCQSTMVSLTPLQGKDESWFAKIYCHHCGEQAFLQLDLTISQTSDEFDWDNLEGSLLHGLQNEWQEWVNLKKRHLYQQKTHTRQRGKQLSIFLIVAMVFGMLFFLMDRYHLLGVVLENITARQQVIVRYVKQLAQLPCFAEQMLETINTVPVFYTPESVYHHNKIQYGETGFYWGEFQIKIHRSNFWFYGQPKKSLLIETLIHEFRHRASPWLAHNDRFYELVQRDTQCALRYWD